MPLQAGRLFPIWRHQNNARRLAYYSDSVIYTSNETGGRAEKPVSSFLEEGHDCMEQGNKLICVNYEEQQTAINVNKKKDNSSRAQRKSITHGVLGRRAPRRRISK